MTSAWRWLTPRVLPPFLSDPAKADWLYRHVAGRTSGASTEETLRRFGGRAIMGIGISSLAIGVITQLAGSTVFGFLPILAVPAGLLFVAVDFACLFYAIATVETYQDQFDLLRLTPIPATRLVETLQQVAQARAWRLLLVMQGLRLFISVAVLGVMIVFVVIFTLGAGLVWVGIYALLVFGEPVRRLQMMTALGVLAAVRSQQAGGRWLLGIGGMLGVWLSQGVVALLPIIALRANVDASLLSITLFTGILALMTVVVFWGQRRAEQACLGQAEKHIFELDG